MAGEDIGRGIEPGIEFEAELSQPMKKQRQNLDPNHSHRNDETHPRLPYFESEKVRTSYKIGTGWALKKHNLLLPSTRQEEEEEGETSTSNSADLSDSQGKRGAMSVKLEEGKEPVSSVVDQNSNYSKDLFDMATSLIMSTHRPKGDLIYTSAHAVPLPPSRPVWKIDRVITEAHLGPVTSIAFDSRNSWFCTGSADRTIKIWDFVTGELIVPLVRKHTGQIRALAVSPRRRNRMYSTGDDQHVKCWDLEHDTVIHSFHAHLGSVYCLSLHPTCRSVLFTGGLDTFCHAWDIRANCNTPICVFSGHDRAVCTLFTRSDVPMLVSGSHDATIKLWDLRQGKTLETLTHHNKSVRALAQHPMQQHCFASASVDQVTKFKLPKGEFLQHMFSQHSTVIHAMAVNKDGVLASAGNNGSLWFSDWNTGHNFQQAQTAPKPAASLDDEDAIYGLSYDNTGSSLVTCKADKSITIWKEVKDVRLSCVEDLTTI